MTSIKRENWKGKYYITARLDNGRVITRKKWDKDFNLDKAVRQFKKTRSFDPNIVRVSLNKTFEVNDYRVKTDKDKNVIKYNFKKSRTYGAFQYVITVRIRNQIISSRSRQYDNKKDNDKAREDALNNLYMGLSAVILRETDKNEGQNLYRDSEIINEGIIYYSDKR